jgi:hypothetical protein
MAKGETIPISAMRDLITSMLVGLVLPAVVLLTVAAIPPYGEPAATATPAVISTR